MMADTLVHPDPDWVVGKHALMNLHGLRRNGRTEIDPKRWRIPFQWQGTHYQDNDDQPFLLLINSGGGYVEGDVTQLTGRFDADTRALVTTTAASKFYKCLGGEISRELVHLQAGPRALLEYVPDESIPFARSRVERNIRLEIQRDTRLFATDVIAAGRVHHANGEAFAFDSLISEFAVVIEGETVLLDRIVACDREEVCALEALWEGAPHLATIVAHGEDFPDDVEGRIEAALAAFDLRSCGATRMGHLVVSRLLADEAWICQEAVQAVWGVLRPHLAGKPARPIRKC